MNRLQKKCVVASAALHGLLFAVLLFGPAFLRSQPAPIDNRPLLSVIPRHLIDEALSGGGDPAAPSAQPAETDQLVPPASPAPQQPPVVAVPPPAEPEPKESPSIEKSVEKPESIKEKPVPPKPTPRTKPKNKPEPERVEPTEESLRKTNDRSKTPKTKEEPVFELKPAVRSNENKAAEKTKAEAKAHAEAKAKAEKAASDAWSGALGSLRKNLTGPSTSIETLGGTGGEAYADYSLAVKTFYTRAWQTPNDVDDTRISVKVQITVASTGRVIDARITRTSGNASLDDSVNTTLKRVRELPPFPAGAKDSQRSFELNFNLKAKRTLG